MTLVSSSDVSISRIGPESDVVLRNLFEHYIHDMAEWFDIDTRADGSYSYNTSAIWADGCAVYLARIGDRIAGFAIAGSADEWLGAGDVRDVREFFVIRRFRRNGVGQKWRSSSGRNAPASGWFESSTRTHQRCSSGGRRLQAIRTIRTKRKRTLLTGVSGDSSASYPPAKRSRPAAQTPRAAPPYSVSFSRPRMWSR